LPPLLSTLVHTGRAPDLSPRHLIFALPFWAAFVGVAVARIPFSALAVVAVAVVAALSPQGIHDPRSITYTANLGTEEALAAPSQWLRARITSVDLLYPYSSVFLAALPEAGNATSLPRGQATTLVDTLKRVDYPVARVFVAVPTGTTQVDPSKIGVLHATAFERWWIIELRGEFNDRDSVMLAIAEALQTFQVALRPPVPDALAGWFDLNTSVLCKAVAAKSTGCAAQ
jgi:hypothetical protein